MIAIKAADTIFAIKIMIKGEGDRYSNLINPNSLSQTIDIELTTPVNKAVMHINPGIKKEK